MSKWNINKTSSSEYFQWDTMVIICNIKNNIAYDIKTCVMNIKLWCHWLYWCHREIDTPSDKPTIYRLGIWESRDDTRADMRNIIIYTVRPKLSTTWLVSIISFLIMNLFQIGLLFSLPVHTYLLTCETGYWSLFIYVYLTGCVKCHVYFSTFVFANESWFFFV